MTAALLKNRFDIDDQSISTIVERYTLTNKVIYYENQRRVCDLLWHDQDNGPSRSKDLSKVYEGLK
jgi:hypothetical protein